MSAKIHTWEDVLASEFEQELEQEAEQAHELLPVEQVLEEHCCFGVFAAGSTSPLHSEVSLASAVLSFSFCRAAWPFPVSESSFCSRALALSNRDCNSYATAAESPTNSSGN